MAALASRWVSDRLTGLLSYDTDALPIHGNGANQSIEDRYDMRIYFT